MFQRCLGALLTGPTVNIKGDGSKALKKLEELQAKFPKGKRTVSVGVPKDANNYLDGTSVLMVAIVHEFGNDDIGVPERSFIRTTIFENREEYKDFIRKLSKKMVAGKMDTPQALGLLGLKVSSDIKEKIRTLDSPPLKHRVGNPLVDTGHLIEVITFQVDR